MPSWPDLSPAEVRAEPNLTPLLDVVFQLITFFMLVINFTSENYDQRVHLPVAGSARPVEDSQQVSEDRLVLNIDKDGHLLVGGQVQPLNEAIATIKHQADLVKLNLRASGLKFDAGKGLPTTIIFRADKDSVFSSVMSLLNACQTQGFRKFALKAMKGVTEAATDVHRSPEGGSMRRRSLRQKVDGPNVPIAPMLDMAFQLLTFFVLTYHPAPQEGQFVMTLLPAQPATAMAAAPAANQPATSNDLPVSLRTLPTILKAGDGGSLGRIVVEQTEVPNDPRALEEALGKYLQDPDLPFDQTLLKVDPNLRYSELMTVINAFSNAFAKAEERPEAELHRAAS